MRLLAVAAVVACAIPFATVPPLRAETAQKSANEACATCHAQAARDWDASAHHRSASDPAYVEAVTHEPLAFCRGCHAPSADPKHPTPPAAQAAGIGCVDCHAGIPAKHDATTRMPKARACEGCHEFRFPEGTAFMQKTAAEHAASGYADRSCASCHGGHRFDVASLLPKAMDARVTREGSRVVFHLVPGAIGHSFPTGDLFRRLVVRVEAVDPSGAVVARTGRVLARHFRSSGASRVEQSDDRVGPRDARDFELDVGPHGAALPLRVEIAYEAPADGSDTSNVHVPLFTKTL